MKYRVGDTADEIEVGQYRVVNKGALKAFFSLVIYPSGQKMLDCRHFQQGNNCWFSFPQKEIKKPDQEKPDYIPLISYLNKEYLEKLKTAVTAALKEATPQEYNGQAKVQSHPRQANQVRSSAPSSWEECPF